MSAQTVSADKPSNRHPALDRYSQPNSALISIWRINRSTPARGSQVWLMMSLAIHFADS